MASFGPHKGTHYVILKRHALLGCSVVAWTARVLSEQAGVET